MLGILLVQTLLLFAAWAGNKAPSIGSAGNPGNAGNTDTAAHSNDLGSTGVDGSTGCSALPLRFRLCCRSNLLCYLLFLMGLIIIYKSFTTKPQ